MKKYFQSLYFILGCLAIVSSGKFAFGQDHLDKSITVSRIDKETYSSIGNTEGYLLESELLKRVEQLFDYQFKHVEGQPFKRMNLNFVHSESDILIGFCIQNEGIEYLLNKGGYEKYPLISSTLYRYQGFRIYTRKSDPIIKSLDGLISKKVGIVNGMALPARLSDLDSDLSDKINMEAVDTEKQNILKLKLGRIDAFISNAAESALELENKNYSSSDFHSSKELERINCGVVLHQSNIGAKLLSAFNVAISDMYLDGSYCKIMNNSKVSTISCSEQK